MTNDLVGTTGTCPLQINNITRWHRHKIGNGGHCIHQGWRSSDTYQSAIDRVDT